jgi:predicted ArsR family transcriptional regulator
MRQPQASGFDDLAGKQEAILSYLERVGFATLEQIQAELQTPVKNIREALKRLELDKKVRYSQGKWNAIER